MAKGFTLVELVGVIAIAGILAAVAAPRFFTSSTFESRGYFDAASGFLRYAQKLAIARHTDITVQITDSGLALIGGSASPLRWNRSAKKPMPLRLINARCKPA